VGLSQDGGSLIVATPSGEELTIAVDEQLHAVLRGDRPRLGQLEIEMDQALGPRDIQARIRAGQSLEEVARVAGIPLDRVERFAAPVLAEREHVALVALSSSVRRRGETSGHRVLRLAAGERLQQRGVHLDTVDWNAYKREDGRWSVTADYQSGEARRQAVFVFDLRGRFSVADNDEARWLLSEQSSLKGPQPGRRRPAGEAADGADEEASGPDTEPTLDLSDELALVRVIQPPAGAVAPPAADEEPEPAAAEPPQPTVGHGARPAARTEPRGLHAVPDQPASAPEDTREQDEPEALRGAEQQAGGSEALADQAGDQDASGMDEAAAESQLDVLDRMLDGAVDPAAAYGGLSDASAVPVTDLGGWEPGLVVDYPVEPGLEPADQADEAAPEPSPGTGLPGPAQPWAPTEPERVEPAEAVEPAESVEQPLDHADDDEQPSRPVPERPATPVRPAARRKRASVPSWDEIMFGGPTPPS
jgi:hypothetical protein